MFKKRLLSCAVLTALSVASAQSMAAGFQLNSQSATGLGRAFAGDAVIADNASAMARNPATMAMFKETSMSLGFTVIDTDVRIKDGTYNQFRSQGIHTGQNEIDISGTDGIGSTAVVPNFYLVVPVNDQWAWGISAYSNFGTGTEFKDDFAASVFGGTTEIKSMNFGASVSYRLNEQWSFGAGLDLIYGIGKLKRDIDFENCINEGNILKPDWQCSTNKFNALDVDASGFAVGGNVGVVYEVNDNHRFGLSYRYSPTVTAKGDVNTVAGNADKMDMPLPDMAEFSGYHRLHDKFAAHYSVQWVQWSAFDTLYMGGIEKEYAWKDAGHISVGGTYYLNNDWTLRAGYMYDVAATDDIKSISIPDSDRQWLSAGFTYHIDTRSNVDFGATYLIGKDTQVDEFMGIEVGDRPIGTSVSATTRADAILVGLQYSRTF
ncbi:aromatic hydrocarbon degradation protein [Photobacterium gaetbulicola]|uniref:Putative long-chain fatty acid transport protein n=1 Tax=Photobacterium gaetbulicola Gung47 TaxID=658445 RepID=A0A0C5WZ31_9GAMM|nr:outer membrane protein transport protein [Photobacterium gaetbulicola]AJR08255.1 putative long-chain fatty acid transport protein [Photobacterium gaetbulicola Gung47]PSU09065.1 aromatic hydrocarbon degradation protein [Photobacterium gaetbulicola]